MFFTLDKNIHALEKNLGMKENIRINMYLFIDVWINIYLHITEPYICNHKYHIIAMHRKSNLNYSYVIGVCSHSVHYLLTSDKSQFKWNRFDKN